MKRQIVKGWKSQSLLLHRHLTRPGSAALGVGLLPRFADCALRIGCLAAAIAGRAKKRWRDGDSERLTIEHVRSARIQMNALLDDLESALAGELPDAVPTAAAADAYSSHGLLALSGLALVEEAGELAEPLLSAASGDAGVSDIRRSVEDEAADLRIWLHIVDNAFSIDPVSTTQRKWDLFSQTRPQDISGALQPRRMTSAEIDQAMASIRPRQNTVLRRPNTDFE